MASDSDQVSMRVVSQIFILVLFAVSANAQIGKGDITEPEVSIITDPIIPKPNLAVITHKVTLFLKEISECKDKKEKFRTIVEFLNYLDYLKFFEKKDESCKIKSDFEKCLFSDHIKSKIKALESSKDLNQYLLINENLSSEDIIIVHDKLKKLGKQK